MTTEANQAVFLSYASSRSRRTEAARRICDTLRAAAVDVCFDRNELVGGDAWDARCARSFELGVLSSELESIKGLRA
jgi:hypothetical protein